MNEAYAHTTAPYVGLINNDVVLDADWLAHVRDALDRDAQLAAVQTIIRRPDGLIDGAGSTSATARSARSDTASPSAHRSRSRGASPQRPRSTAARHSADASSMSVCSPTTKTSSSPRACARSGWRTAVLPVVKATHRGSASASLLGSRALRLRTRNRYLVARMHRGAGSIAALLWEDARLLPRGRTSLRGLIEGLCSRL